MFSGKKEPKNMKNECADLQKLSKWLPFWNFWRPFGNSAGILRDFCYLKMLFQVITSFLSVKYQ